MKQTLLLALAVLIAIVVAVMVASSRGTGPEATPLTVEFSRPGVVIVRGLTGAADVSILDNERRPVVQAETWGHDEVELRFAWAPGARYTAETSDKRFVEADAPESAPEVAVRIHAPLGQQAREYLFDAQPSHLPHQYISVPTAPHVTTDIMLEVEKLQDTEPMEFRITADTPVSMLADLDPPLPVGEHSLAFEFDKLTWLAQARTGDALPDTPLGFTVHGPDFTLPIRLEFVGRSSGPGDISVDHWVMPTDEAGNAHPQRMADEIVMRNPVWTRLAAWTGMKPSAVDTYAPETWQTLWLRNSGDEPVALFVACEVVSIETGRPVAYFRDAQADGAGGRSLMRARVRVGPGQIEPCILPLYVDNDTPEGTYLRVVTVQMVGSDDVILHTEREIGVVRGRPMFSAWVASAILLSLLWLALTAALYRRAVRSFGVRVVVLLALLGSLQFCLHFIGGLASSVLYAVLGPFNCLVGGLLTEVLTYLLITATLFLVPRVGAMTLAGLVTYFMGGIMFGSFGVTDVVYVGSAIAFRELALLLFGVTSTKDRPEPPRLLPMLLALALADAAATYTALALQGVFYRLFFADWYIVLQVAVTGFAYTALGVWMGTSLGRSLRRVNL